MNTQTNSYLRIQVSIAMIIFLITNFYLFGIMGIVAPISIGLIMELLYLKSTVRISNKIMTLGIIYALSGSYAAYYLYQISFELSQAIVYSIVTSDIAAYYIGKYWGRKKLYPSISPNKTILGAIAGIVTGTAIFSFAGYNAFECKTCLVSVGIFISILGIIGDLLISKVKRVYNLKDSSAIFPGHGGFWDRFDSLLLVLNAASIYFAFNNVSNIHYLLHISF